MGIDEGPAYEPVDLSTFYNAGLALLEGHRRPPVGAVTFRGIPFRIGDPVDERAPCFVLLEPGAPSARVPVSRRGDRFILAHRWLRRAGPEMDPAPGTPMAEYTFHLGD